jgi:hypothetical protein
MLRSAAKRRVSKHEAEAHPRRLFLTARETPETLRGKPREQVVASWLDRDFLTSTQWNLQTDLIVAATENAQGSTGSEIQVLHERCSQPFEDSKEILDAIKNALEH